MGNLWFSGAEDALDSFAPRQESDRTAPLETMDILVISAYLCDMFARAVTMLGVLAIAVVTTVSSVHAAQMSVAPDHAIHTGEMMHASEGSGISCDGEQHCGSADMGNCEFGCASLAAFLTAPSEEARQARRPANHTPSSGPTLASRAAALNEHPPKFRLF